MRFHIWPRMLIAPLCVHPLNAKTCFLGFGTVLRKSQTCFPIRYSFIQSPAQTHTQMIFPVPKVVGTNNCRSCRLAFAINHFPPAPTALRTKSFAWRRPTKTKWHFQLPAMPLHNDLLLTFSFRFQFLTYVRSSRRTASPHILRPLPFRTRIDTKPNFIFVRITCDLCILLGSLSVRRRRPNVPYFAFFISRRRQCVGFIKYVRIEQRKTFDTFHSPISRETMFAISFLFHCANYPNGREQCVPRLWRYRPKKIDKK